jgi:hypothetical protein
MFGVRNRRRTNGPAPNCTILNERRLTMEERDSNLDSMYQELAERFGALSRLFRELSSPDAVKELLDSLTLADVAKPFPQIVDINIHMVGKCFWLRELIEHVVTTPAGLVEECRVRDDLTPSEIGLYFSIAWRHRDRTLMGKQKGVVIHDTSRVVPAGPFLDELKANGLVTCTFEMTYNTSTTLVFSKPEHVCI